MFKSDRHFRLWEFKVSHNQALIRSPRSTDNPTNVDVVFWGVKTINLPTSFDGLELTQREEGHYILVTGSQSFSIVAGGFKVLENKLDIFESSLEGFAATDESHDLGNVLAHS